MAPLDPETGIYQYTEDDDETTFSELLNLLTDSLRNVIGPRINDTGWQDFRNLAGINNVTWASPAAGNPPEIRRIGNRVYLRGAMDNSTAYTSTTQIGTIPDGFKPGFRLGAATNAVAYFPVSAGASTATKQIRIFNIIGRLDVYAPTATSIWGFDGISWDTDDAWPEGY